MLKPLQCYQGATFRRGTSLVNKTTKTPYDLTGCTARMQVRNAARDLIVELTTENGRITIDALAGKVILSLTPVEMAALPNGTYDTDLFLTWPDGTVWTLWRRGFVVTEAVTK